MSDWNEWTLIANGCDGKLTLWRKKGDHINTYEVRLAGKIALDCDCQDIAWTIFWSICDHTIVNIINN